MLNQLLAKILPTADTDIPSYFMESEVRVELTHFRVQCENKSGATLLAVLGGYNADLQTEYKRRRKTVDI